MRFDVHFKQSNQRIAVSFQNNSKVLGADFKSFQRVTVQPDVEHYTGDYSVIPKTDSQVLPTKRAVSDGRCRNRGNPLF